MFFTISSPTLVADSDVGEGLGEAEVIPLWPDGSGMNDNDVRGRLKADRGGGHIRVTDVGMPTMLYFPAKDAGDATPAVILCPGGGYSNLVLTKQTPTAEWLNERGISAFILKYRTPKKRDAAFNDIQRAIRTVRSRAKEWNIDPNRIGVMGSSAGGHLAARASTGFNEESYRPIDPIDKASSRPDFTALLFPAYMNNKSDDTLNDVFDLSVDVPATLIISARDDTKFFRGSEVYQQALEDADHSVRVHYYDEGGHGFSIVGNKPPLSEWPEKFHQWLKDINVIQGDSKTVTIDGIEIKVSPKKFPPTFRDVAYGPHERNKLDFWQAESDEPTPVVFYIHGGGWRSGSKESNKGPYLGLLDEGVSYVSINYRLATGDNVLPCSVHDAARALQFVRSKADEWNIDPERIIATGGSAGGCSSLWLAYHDDLADPDSSDPIARQSTRILSAATIVAQSTIDPHLVYERVGLNAAQHPMIWETVGAPSLKALVDNREKYEPIFTEVSPLTHVSKDDPPVFLVYSKDTPAPVEKDGIHHVEFGRILKEKCDELGLECTLVIVGKETREAALDAFMLSQFEAAK